MVPKLITSPRNMPVRFVSPEGKLIRRDVQRHSYHGFEVLVANPIANLADFAVDVTLVTSFTVYSATCIACKDSDWAIRL